MFTTIIVFHEAHNSGFSSLKGLFTKWQKVVIELVNGTKTLWPVEKSYN